MATTVKLLTALSYALCLVCFVLFGYSVGTLIQFGFDGISFGILVLSLFSGVNFWVIFYDTLDYYRVK